MNKSYNELSRLQTFEDRFDYLKLNGVVCRSTFGYDRYLNQMLYQSREWKHTRSGIILRDDGCDLGISDRQIYGQLVIHHINFITVEDIEQGEDIVFDPNNLITTALATHNAIHYGDISLIPRLPEERKQNDTCPWARR